MQVKNRVHIIVLLLIILSVPSASAQGLIDYKIKVEEALKHDPTAYTQGLFFYDGKLYESTGQYGESSFRTVDLETGKVLNRINYDKKYFVEGSVVLNNKLYVLTWMEHDVFVYDMNTLKEIARLRNPREGWGLTTNGSDLIMSDGSSKIYYIDPDTFLVRREIEVKLNGRSLYNINELEYINGDIWANIYGTDYIVIIDPDTGYIKGRVDCTGLLPASLKRGTDVLNGIAYNPETGYIYITGKYWPRLYRVSLIKK